MHIIPHSHVDVGWYLTVDQYYQGGYWSNRCVICILNNMLKSLKANDKRTFIFGEMVYFKRWYDDLEPTDKEYVKQLIKEQRLEIINGGWVMNDEATAIYQDIINQIRIGLDFVFLEFGIRPRTAYYIDSFGHSLTNVIVFNLGIYPF